MNLVTTPMDGGSPKNSSPILSPLSDENAMRWLSRNHQNHNRQRPRLETAETLVAANGVGGGTRVVRDARHIHTMSEENPFLPTDDEIDNHEDGGEDDDVSSVSNDSLKRFQNWVPPSPSQQHLMWSPFVPPREIVIMVKNENQAETVPDWLKVPVRDPALPRGPPPPPSVFSQLSDHPLLTDSPCTAPHPLLSPCDHLRNMSWATATTTSMSLQRASSQDTATNDHGPPTRRRHCRGVSQAISIGSLVGQSSFVIAGEGGSLVSLPTTTSSSLSLSGESFAHTRRANKKLDDLVLSPRSNPRRSIKNPLKEEVLYMLDKVSAPVKRLVTTNSRCKSYDLHASEHGCLA